MAEKRIFALSGISLSIINLVLFQVLFFRETIFVKAFGLVLALFTFCLSIATIPISRMILRFGEKYSGIKKTLYFILIPIGIVVLLVLFRLVGSCVVSNAHDWAGLGKALFLGFMQIVVGIALFLPYLQTLVFLLIRKTKNFHQRTE